MIKVYLFFETKILRKTIAYFLVSFIYMLISTNISLSELLIPKNKQFIETDRLHFSLGVSKPELELLSKFLNIDAENYIISKMNNKDINIYRIDGPKFCKYNQCLIIVSKKNIIVNYFYSNPRISYYYYQGDIYRIIISNKCGNIDVEFDELAIEEKTTELMCGDLK